MAVKTGRSHPGHPKYGDNRGALELPFARHDYSPSIQGAYDPVNFSKRKAEAGSSLCLPVPIT
jgi:hypothetical protein